jgi:hypothetical protein
MKLDPYPGPLDPLDFAAGEGYVDMNTSVGLEAAGLSDEQQAVRRILARVAVMLRKGRPDMALAEIPYTEFEAAELGPR